MKDIYSLILSAQEKAQENQKEILAIAEAMELRYGHSKARRASWQEIWNCLILLCLEAEKTFYLKTQRGETPITSVASGGWEVRIDFWNNEPSVRITFGFNTY